MTNLKAKLNGGGGEKYKIEAFDSERLIAAIQNDIETFEKIDGLISRITFQTDDKLQRLQQLLSNDYKSQKVIVFTEFATTAKYLNEHLKWNGKKQQVDSKTGDIVECARRFDPKHNPDPGHVIQKSDEISLLITTDVLAEGVNLQAGQVVINYDFHWNPTRLIQRAGRIDRINSDNSVIVVHNFLLDPQMEKDIRLELTTEQKINQIQKIIGEDYKILKENEQINTADNYAIYNCDDQILDREEENPIEPTEIESMLQNIKQKQPELWRQIKELPNGIRGSDATVSFAGNLLLGCESANADGELLRKYYIVDGTNVLEISAVQALERLKSDDTKPHAVPESYDRLIAMGWRKFVTDVEQIEARIRHPALKPNQVWVLETLLKLGSQKRPDSQRELVETLYKAFSIPIKKIKLDRDLRKIRKRKLDEDQILSQLAALYRHYGLQNYSVDGDKSFPSRRILWSKWIGVKNVN